MNLSQFTRVKQELEQLKGSQNRLAGERAQLMKRLEELGCETVKQARRLLRQLEDEQQDQEEKYAKALRAVERAKARRPDEN